MKFMVLILLISLKDSKRKILNNLDEYFRAYSLYLKFWGNYQYIKVVVVKFMINTRDSLKNMINTFQKVLIKN